MSLLLLLKGISGPVPQTLVGTLFTDPDTFFSHTIIFDQTLVGILLTDPDTFFGGVLVQFFGTWTPEGGVSGTWLVESGASGAWTPESPP